jgi:AraC-like DNA-binding protein
MRKFFTHTDRVLPVHHPRVVVETAVALGASREALFENSELTPEMLTSPDMRVSYVQYGILCSNALRLTKDPALGLHVGRNTGIAQMGALGFLLQNSPTVGAAFEALVRYGRPIIPAWDLSLERSGPRATLTFAEAIPLAPFRQFAHEVVLTAVDNQTRTLYGGRPVPVRRIELPYPEPEYVSLYRELYYDVPMAFERPVAKVEFDAALLDEPIAFADPATAKLAEQLCIQLLPPDPSQEGLVSQVRRLLVGVTGPSPGLPEVAQRLQTSTRTLRRELNRMRTSYKELVDESRRVRAEEWVETNSMPLEQLATGLGFATVGSFRRAFKRWTGSTPSARRGRKD